LTRTFHRYENSPGKNGLSRILCILCFLQLSILLRLAPPDVTMGDTGELLIASGYLTGAHPPGYPLWILVSKSFTLFPLGSQAWKASLFSQVFTIGAMLLLCVGLRYTLSKRNAWIASLAVGFMLLSSPRILNTGLEMEVYGFHLFFVSWMVFWGCGNPSRHAGLGFLILGLALSNHYMSLSCVPLILLCLSPETLHPLKLLRRAPRWGSCFLLGLSPYLMLPLRGDVPFLPGWSQNQQVHGFLDTIRRIVYSEPRVAQPFSTVLFQQGLFVQNWLLPHLLPILLLAGPGFWILWKWNRSRTLSFLSTLIFSGPILVWWARLPLDEQSQRILQPFYSGFVLLWIFFSGLGVSFLFRHRLYTGTALILSLGTAHLILALPLASHRHAYGGLTFIQFLSRGLPRKSGLWSASDSMTFLAQYMMNMESRGENRSVLSQRLPYWRSVIRTGQDPFPLPDEKSLQAFQESLSGTPRQTDLSRWIQIQTWEQSGHLSLYWEAQASSQMLWSRLREEGPLLARPSNHGTFSETLDAWFAPNALHDREVSRFIAGLHGNLGTFQATQGDVNLAMSSWSKAIAMDPFSASPWSNMGSVMARTGDLETARDMLRQALRLDPYHHDAAVNLSIVLLSQGQIEESRRWANLAKRFHPDRLEADQVLEHIEKATAALSP